MFDNIPDRPRMRVLSARKGERRFLYSEYLDADYVLVVASSTSTTSYALTASRTSVHLVVSRVIGCDRSGMSQAFDTL